MNTNSIFIGSFLLDEILGRVIEQGTGGDKAKIAARATQGLLVVSGFNSILNGDAADGVNAITAAVSGSTDLSPYQALAIQNLAALAAQNLAVAENIGGGTLLGTAANAIATKVLAEMTRVLVAEGGTPPATPPVTPPASGG